MVEYYDPTVVFWVCGHGMHEKCAESNFPKMKESAVNEREAIGFCPICKKSVARNDILKLRGIVPLTENASAWRSILLTEPWSIVPPSSGLTTPSESCFDELLLSLRKLFRDQGRISNHLKLSEIQMKKKYERLRADITRREQNVDDEQDKLIRKEIRLQRAAAATYERLDARETELTIKSNELIQQQHELLRLRADISRRESQLRKEIFKFEDTQKKDLQSISVARNALQMERRAISKRKMALEESGKKQNRPSHKSRISPESNDVDLFRNTPHKADSDVEEFIAEASEAPQDERNG